MGIEWTSLKFIDAPLDIIDGDRGKNYPKQHEFIEAGYCLFLNAGNVTQDGFNFSQCSFISEDKDLSLHKGKLQRHDVVLTTRGTVGNGAYYDDSISFDNIRINSGMVIFRANTHRLLPRFLYLFIRSNLFMNQVQSLRTGSAQPQLPIRDINRIEIPLPPLSEQRAIAHILGSLDDKIELNRQMNQTLEAMAQAIFKSWFVDFDPVKAKMEGRDTGLPAEIDHLFPDSFEQSELGLVPKGWKPVQLAELIELIGGGTPKTSKVEYWNGDIPWFSVVDAPDSSDVFVINTEKHITRSGLQNSSTKILPFGTTIISARGTVGKCALVGTPMAMNQSCYGIAGINGRGSYFTYFLIRKQVSDLQRSGHGSVFNTITRDTFKSIISIDTGPEITQQFDKSVDSFLRLIHTNLCEIKVLKQQRDALLPKLISGELRVPDVEALLKEAGL